MLMIWQAPRAMASAADRADVRLVQADRGGDPPPQLGMSARVVLRKRLLDEQEIERVELRTVTGPERGGVIRRYDSPG